VPQKGDFLRGYRALVSGASLGYMIRYVKILKHWLIS